MLNRSQAIRNVIIFALLVNGLAWLGSFLGGDPVTPGPGFLLWGVAPLLSALIMRFVLRDPVTLGIRPQIRGNRGWYALSLLLYPVSILAILGMGLLLGTTRLEGFTLPALFTAMAAPVVIYFVFALFEEVGWRGYLAPRVSEIDDRLPGYLVVGVIWASWHFPYLTDLWDHTDESLLTLVPRFLLGVVIATVVYGEIRLRVNSFWPAVLMHWSANTLANTLLSGFVIFAPGRAWLGSFGIEGVLMMIIFAVVGGWLYRQRRAESANV